MRRGRRRLRNRMPLHSVQGTNNPVQFSSACGQEMMNRMRNNLASPFNVSAFLPRLRCGHARDEGIGIDGECRAMRELGSMVNVKG